MRVVALGVLLASVFAGGSVEAATCWLPPVSAPVADPFREPLCRWCPGNRGIEYATHAGDAVRAVASGRVTFSGTVAGRTYVVVQHADGRRATYGNLADHLYAQGDVIATGAVIGHVAGVFHLGLREGDRYVDPAPFIGELVGITRLVPNDGVTPARAAQPRLVCAAATSVGNARPAS